ncbi:MULTISPECIES: hypothetical protein [Halobacterium]|uniref:hypothetical protein n=1 Tax=Halobacterium TaxID=2239 RepID=UPI0019631D3F|nr:MULTISPECIES: hypothetical protein [Halobacterium]MDL0123095.1 hypothetical protein [Halobacterium salinarum]MDL0127515.1 hypothetical protein [Halobacterium salinarum]MDL0132763.1 hypothetical protein [Halobacterium salinarum]QRY25170.1 hypothetical protein JRZ79_01845 [Halobacterium sp. BOL4-2]
MEISVHGDGDDREPVLVVLGWGNHPGQANVAWLIDGLVAAGREVHAATLPTNASSFERAYMRPLASYVADRTFDAVVAHSLGGLVTATLDWDVRRVYLSPWWGVREGVQSAVFRALAALPTSRPLVPAAGSVGDISEPTPRETTRLSPTFVREVRRAQASLPAFRPDSTVFCSLTDAIVSVAAIGERTPAANLRVYDGGHEFFSSTGRAAVLDDVVAALRDGPAAVAGAST